MDSNSNSNPSEKSRGTGKTERQRIQRSRDSDDSDDREEIDEFTAAINLPLHEYTRMAEEYAFTNSPEDGEQWRSLTWDFTRLLKLHPKLNRLSAEEAVQTIPWQLTDFAEDEQLQVLLEWDRVKYLPGQTPFDVALSLAAQKPLTPKRCKGGRSALYGSFISLCGWLQVLVGEGEPIYLPVRKTAKALNCTKDMISTFRSLAVKDGFLQICTTHNAYRATRFAFVVDKFPKLRLLDNRTRESL